MKQTIILIFFLLPALAFGGLSQGSRDCSQNYRDYQSFGITLGDLAKSLEMQPAEIMRKDGYFAQLSPADKEKEILGQGKFGSSKTIVRIDRKCQSANGGMKITLSLPSGVRQSVRSSVLGFDDDKLVDILDVTEVITEDRFVFEGGHLKVTVDFGSTIPTDLILNGYGAENIKVSILNKDKGVVIER